VGLTPKRYARLLRFRRVLLHARAPGAPGWTEIAHSCGYYDQSHFVRDFKAFSGFTPSEYSKHVGPSENHVPIE
jgi:AraC-like DNA-binding protein